MSSQSAASYHDINRQTLDRLRQLRRDLEAEQRRELGAGSGATDFLNLTDTPSSYSGAGSAVVYVGTAGTSLLFGPVLPATSGTVVLRTATQTLTNKTMSGTANTFTNLPNSALTNSQITVGTSVVSLGGTVATTDFSGDLVPVMRVIRSGNTDGVRESLMLKAQRTNAASDGYGPQLLFAMEDNSASEGLLGAIAALRAGADNDGDLAFYAAVSGVLTEMMRITTGGFVGFRESSPQYSLEARNDGTATTIAHGMTNFSTATTAGVGMIFRLGDSGGNKRDAGRFIVGKDDIYSSGDANTRDAYMAWLLASNAAMTERMRLTNLGYLGVNVDAPTAQAHIDQASTTAAVPVLLLDQADLSEEFIRFVASAGASNPIQTGTVGPYLAKVRVNLNGTAGYIPIYSA